jgi:hypothetical protein
MEPKNIQKLRTYIRQILSESEESTLIEFSLTDPQNNNDNILTDKYIRNFIKNGDADGTGLLGWYIQLNDLDENDFDSARESEGFFEFMKQELTNRLEEAKENIYDRISYHNNKIMLYRAITVDENWFRHLVSQGKRLGIYWSWDGDGAETHWGDHNKKHEAVISTEIDEKYIDWTKTLEMNMHPNFDTEKEIRLFKNTPIKINSLTIDAKPIDISLIQNKIFLA